MTGVHFPTPVQDVKKIEMNNDISINVFAYEKTDGIVPLYRTKQVKTQHVNLMLLKDEEKSHYCLIKDFSRLMAHRSKDGHKMFYCCNCLHAFIRKDLLDTHTELCYQQQVQRTVYAEEDATIQFKKIYKQLRAPFVIYADFECYTEKTDNPTNTKPPGTTLPHKTS